MKDGDRMFDEILKLREVTNEEILEDMKLSKIYEYIHKLKEVNRELISALEIIEKITDKKFSFYNCKDWLDAEVMSISELKCHILELEKGILEKKKILRLATCN